MNKFYRDDHDSMHEIATIIWLTSITYVIMGNCICWPRGPPFLGGGGAGCDRTPAPWASPQLLCSLVAAESILQPPMQPARDHPLFCEFWMCISIVVWNKSVPKVFWGVWPWPSTFRGHLGSKIFSLFESPYMTSYLTSIDTFSLSRTVFEIFDYKVFMVWPWPLEVTWGQKYLDHLKPHTWLPN